MVAMNDVIELSGRIVRAFEPERIILFGSYAYGRPTEHSDVDLIVVMPFERSGFDKSLEILNELDPPFAVDLLARTPEDMARRYAEHDPLVREAMDRGRVLYERHG